jgi:hypothetical protein
MQWRVLPMFRKNLVFKKRFISKTICTARSKSNKTVLTTNLNNYVYFNKSEIGENIKNISLKMI